MSTEKDTGGGARPTPEDAAAGCGGPLVPTELPKYVKLTVHSVQIIDPQVRRAGGGWGSLAV